MCTRRSTADVASRRSASSPLRCTIFLCVGLLSTARSLSTTTTTTTAVSRLPGFNGELPFSLETGYVRVNEEHGVELFYYFIESEGQPRLDPLLVWLTGGPGCSAFSGLAFEIGPLSFIAEQYNGSLPELRSNQYSWTKMASIIFVDSPVGTGFSYARTPEGFETGDVSSSVHVHKFILKWLEAHPEYLRNPLYIAGDSYAGKLVPAIAHIASEGIEAGVTPLLNLKGYLVGNPTTATDFDRWFQIPYAHGVGIMSDQVYEATRWSCRGQEYGHRRTPRCIEALNRATSLMSAVQLPQILEKKCMSDFPGRTDGEFLKLRRAPPAPDLACRSYGYYLSYFWANDEAVQDALGIRKGTVAEWMRCAGDLRYAKDIGGSIGFHLLLTSKGSYRALVYSGDHDLVVPFLGTQAWIRSLNFSVTDDWRPWHAEDDVGGFCITYSNDMTFATVKGGGHTAPEYRPKECQELIRMWLAGKPLR